MQRSIFALMTAAALGLAASSVQAMPVTSGAVGQAADATGLIEKTAVYIVEGRRYCFYFNGWQGPGWYRCGFAWRRGIGWGGVYGWQGWDYAPAARRFGHHRDGGSVTIREGRGGEGVRDGRRGGDTFRDGGRREGTTFREGTTTREKSSVRGSVPGGQTNTTGEGPRRRGGASVQGEGGRSGPGGGGAGVQMNKSGGPGGGPGGGGQGGGGSGGGGGQGGGRGPGGDKQ